MERLNFYDEIAKNKRKSIFLMIIVFCVFVLLGYVISMATSPDNFFFIMIISIIFSTIYLMVTYNNSDKIALASVNAKLAPKEYRQYYHSVEGLCLASGMPIPKLYVMEDNSINAFASGKDPNHSVICVTKGALEKLDKQELEGVLSHELSHIANYDIRFMTLTAVMVGLIAIISEIFLRSLWFRSFSGSRRSEGDGRIKAIFLIISILLAILAPIVTLLVQMSISRKREFAADSTAVKFTRYPTGLSNALKKIKKDIPMKKVGKAISPLFMSDPKRRIKANLWATHPPIDERIRRLENM